MEQAKHLAESFLGGDERAGDKQVEGGGTSGGGAGGGGLMGMASHAATAYFSGDKKVVDGDERAGEKPGIGGTSGGGESGLLGMASHAATSYFSGNKAVAEGGAADAGLVDKLLATFEAKTGKQFDGADESEYDRLSDMATNLLGTNIGRSVVKSWVKQRLGM